MNMNEWMIFITIGEIVVFIIAVVTPMVKLNTTIVKLNEAIDRLDEKFESLTNKNDKAHDRIWKVIDHLDDISNEHEQRIVVLETMERMGERK